MPTHDRSLTDLATELSRAPDEGTTAATALGQLPHVVAGVEWASMTIRVRGGRMTTLASTDDRAERLDELQYALDEGPCVESARGQEWFRSGDVRADHRWPRWGPEAARLGAASLLSLRLQSDSEPIGALNLYSPRTGAFADADDVEFALLFAAHLATALTAARKLDGLTIALSTRHTIGVAQGMLMERYGLSVDASFNLLQRYSSNHNIKVRDIAEQVVRTRALPGSIEPAPR